MSLRKTLRCITVFAIYYNFFWADLNDFFRFRRRATFLNVRVWAAFHRCLWTESQWRKTSCLTLNFKTRSCTSSCTSHPPSRRLSTTSVPIHASNAFPMLSNRVECLLVLLGWAWRQHERCWLDDDARQRRDATQPTRPQPWHAFSRHVTICRLTTINSLISPTNLILFASVFRRVGFSCARPRNFFSEEFARSNCDHARQSFKQVPSKTRWNYFPLLKKLMRFYFNVIILNLWYFLCCSRWSVRGHCVGGCWSGDGGREGSCVQCHQAHC